MEIKKKGRTKVYKGYIMLTGKTHNKKIEVKRTDNEIERLVRQLFSYFDVI